MLERDDPARSQTGPLRHDKLLSPAWNPATISAISPSLIVRGGDTCKPPPPTARVMTPASRQAKAALAARVGSSTWSWMAASRPTPPRIEVTASRLVSGWSISTNFDSIARARCGSCSRSRMSTTTRPAAHAELCPE